jgi:hypothetical protein
MRIVAVITDPAVTTRILAHRARAQDPTHRSRSHRRADDSHGELDCSDPTELALLPGPGPPYSVPLRKSAA